GLDRIGAGLAALHGARTGGDARTREAVRRALEMLDARRQAGPAPVEIDGFETRLLGPEAFQDLAGALDPGDLIAHLQDGRSVIRANAATALGVLGAVASQAVRPLGVRLRDDDAHVRMAAARALDRLGNDAVRQTADGLVGALGDADPAVAEACAAALRARKASVVGALVRGLDVGSEVHARRILEIINLLDDASDILCDAFESPAENVQVNAALGLGMLGPRRAGTAGRKALEGARTGGFARTRAAVFRALAMLDGQA
ncbi:MAG TPA: HEAT repeat domain-containing protein, partial [Haliangium sp.]|nr:HEAT repeat domain-containing protein [Haliangium sp.]